MNYQIENREIVALIASSGAELFSLKNKKNDLEYIWEALPEAWGRHAPVLFPIVGKLKANSYHYNGQHYFLPQHGFARDKEFTCIRNGSDSVSFQLQEDEETLKNYPFRFSLTITYTLHEARLIISYLVKNPDSGDLYFSIGAHPGFRCPLLPNEDFEDYYLEFEQVETFKRHRISESLVSRESEVIAENKNIIPLTKALFKEDALVFKSLLSRHVIIKSRNHSHEIKVSLDGFPYLGIWTKPIPEATFICIEPWLGIADSTTSTGDLTQKEGIIKLAGGEKYECSYIVEVK